MDPSLMTPEMMAFAAEQMKRMTPEQLSSMMAMAGGASMPGMSPSMLAEAQREMAGMSPAQLEQMRAAAAGLSPAEMAARAQQASKAMSAREQYVYNASTQLKAEGNQLHAAGRYAEAADKYRRAKDNMASSASAEGAALRKACCLNLSSCYLNLGRHGECAAEASEVLAGEPRNLKALYRRGQAHAALAQHAEAVADLAAAEGLSGHDPAQQALIREKLAAARAQLAAQPRPAAQPSAASAAAAASAADEDGLIEELPMDEAAQPKRVVPGAAELQLPGGAAASQQAQQPKQQPMQQQAQQPMQQQQQRGAGSAPSQADMMAQAAEMFAKNPDMVKQATAHLKSLRPEQLQAAFAQAGMPAPPAGFDPAMMQQAAEAMSAMSPEQLAQMAKLSASMGAAGGAMPGLGAAAAGGAGASALGAGGAPSPGLVAAASKMMSALKPEDLAAMSKIMQGGGLQPGGDPAAGLTPELRSSLLKPELMDSMLASLQAMDQASLAQMFKAQGLGDEQAEMAAQQVKRITPTQARLLAKAAVVGQTGLQAAQAARAWVAANQLLVLGIALLLLAILLRWWGIM